jgi:para-nitrobenzyl esterase
MARMSAVARTALGDLQGIAADGVTIFRNVPYAAQPTGPLRFAPPAPPAPWRGMRDATMHGAVAPQPSSRLRIAMGDFDRPQSEDCLALTIATPGVNGARPVIVWLHGGAYLAGGGSLDWYAGEALACEGDVVVVGVNYRLGALGFLHHPAVGAGNYALHDMAAALGWVRDHIAAFGGDPARVTVMGQSAGAHAIMCLLTMPAARALFHRAILLSTPAALRPLTAAAATAYATQLLTHLAIPPERLRDIPAERIVEAQTAVLRGMARFADIAPPFLPMIDALADREALIAAAADGAAAQGIAMIIGTTREEMHAFFAADPAMADPIPDAVAERFATLAGSADAIGAYRARRPGGSVMDLLGDLVTDHSFLFPSLALADAATARGRDVWCYQFDWAAPGNRFKACHCIELPFVFGNPSAWAGAGMLEGADPAAVAALGATVRATLTAFAAAGDPSIGGLPWEPYRPGSRQTMCFGPVTGLIGDPAGAARRTGTSF